MSDKKFNQDIPNTIQFNSRCRGGSHKCIIVTCDQCGGKRFAIYEGSITSGCAGGVFPIVCLDCGYQ